MINNYLVDIEGTIVADKSYTPIQGAVEWLASLKSHGKRFALVSNNTTHPPQDLVRLLRSKRFDVIEENLFGCMTALLDFLKSKKLKSCFVIGNHRLKDFLMNNSIEIKEDENVQAVVLGLDESLNFGKLKIAIQALMNKDAYLLALHENKVYKDKDGKLSPSVGAVVKALEYSSDKKAHILGKPSRIFYKRVLEKLKAPPEESLMISDDPLSDLWGAKRVGINTAFVLSGKYKDEKILKSLKKEYYPDSVYESIAQIPVDKTVSTNQMD